MLLPGMYPNYSHLPPCCKFKSGNNPYILAAMINSIWEGKKTQNSMKKLPHTKEMLPNSGPLLFY